MFKDKLIDFLAKTEDFTKKKSSTILVGFAITGVISSNYLSFKAGLKADEILKEYTKDMKDCHPEDKDAKRAVTGESAKKMIPIVAPPIIIGASTIACIAGSHSVSNRKIAALSAAYNLSESTVRNLNGKMEEMLGEKKTREIKDSIMKDKLNKSSGKEPSVNAVIPGDGTVLCKDLYSGRFFFSNAEKIEQAIVRCSVDIISDMYISLNDFYEAINSPQLDPIPMGNDLGWNVDDVQNGKLPITLTALLTEDKKPCLCLDYDISVRNDFRNLH